MSFLLIEITTSYRLIRKVSERCRGSKSGKRFCTVVNPPTGTYRCFCALLCSLAVFWLCRPLNDVVSSAFLSRPLKFIRGCDSAAGDWHGNSTNGTEKLKTSSPPFLHPNSRFPPPRVSPARFHR